MPTASGWQLPKNMPLIVSNCLIIIAAGNALVFAPGVGSLPDTIIIQQEATSMTGHDFKGKYQLF